MGGFSFDAGQNPPGLEVLQSTSLNLPETRKSHQPRDAIPQSSWFVDEFRDFLAVDPIEFRRNPKSRPYNKPDESKGRKTAANKRHSATPTIEPDGGKRSLEGFFKSRPFSSKQLRQILRSRSESPSRSRLKNIQDLIRKGNLQTGWRLAQQVPSSGSPYYQILQNPSNTGELNISSTYRVNCLNEESAKAAGDEQRDHSEESQSKMHSPIPPVASDGSEDPLRGNYEIMDGLAKECPFFFHKDGNTGHVRRKSPVKDLASPYPVMDQGGKPKVRDFAFEKDGTVSNGGKTVIPRRRDCTVDRSISTSKVCGNQSRANITTSSRRSQTAWARTSLGLTPIDTEKLRSRHPSEGVDSVARMTSDSSPKQHPPNQSLQHAPLKASAPFQGSDSTTETVIRTTSSSKWEETSRAPKVMSPTPAPTGPLPPLPENRDLTSTLQLMPLPPATKKASNDKPLLPIVSSPTPPKDKGFDKQVADGFAHEVPRDCTTSCIQQSQVKSMTPSSSSEFDQLARRATLVSDPGDKDDPFQWRKEKTGAMKRRDLDLKRKENKRKLEESVNKSGTECCDDSGEVIVLPNERQYNGSSGNDGTSLPHLGDISPLSSHRSHDTSPMNGFSSIMTLAEHRPEAGGPLLRPTISDKRTIYRCHSTQYSPRRFEKSNDHGDAQISTSMPLLQSPNIEGDSVMRKNSQPDWRGTNRAPISSTNAFDEGKYIQHQRSQQALQAHELEARMEARMTVFERKTMLLEVALLAVINASAGLSRNNSTSTAAKAAGLGESLSLDAISDMVKGYEDGQGKAGTPR